jgi:8-oxo-dGTP pyrophosphatase MutT (NUDIX family)
MAEIVPLPAATMALVRDADGPLEVLLLQRNFQSGFMPGAQLFPGGAVDPEDDPVHAGCYCECLDDERASRLLDVPAGGVAYWAAAIREAFEEAGVLLTYRKDGSLMEFSDAAVVERYGVHRRRLLAGEKRFIDVLHEEQLQLAADQLVYCGHWITPVTAPRRYDTRFFVARAPSGQEVEADKVEAIGHRWIRPAEALDRHRSGEFKMRSPTVATLKQLADYTSVDQLMTAMRGRSSIPVILPRVSKQGGSLLPGDPGYEAAASEHASGKWKP